MSTNVVSLEPVTRINPGRVGSPGLVDRTLAAQGHGPVRRLTRLDADYYATRRVAPTRSVPAPRAGNAAPPAADRAWLRVVERVAGGWAPTLRGSVALVTLFLVAAVTVVITLGLIGAILVASLGIALACRLIAARRPRR